MSKSTCEHCGRPFDSDGKWGGLCYPCFEDYADRLWWQIMKGEVVWV